MKLRLLPEAERDLEIGADFYESQNTGLGTYFNDCLASDIESLKWHRIGPPLNFVDLSENSFSRTNRLNASQPQLNASGPRSIAT